jgi:DHA1 family bicyclomycin/chloramphenicol resistance-like MFS transporter
MGFVELVAFLASCMAINALSIDIVLPALAQLGADVGVADPNHRQGVIVAYLIGMGLSQLVFGPASDRYGRRPILLVGLGVFTAASLAAALAPTFSVLLVARLVQGLGAGAPRVVALSIARDRYGGSEMARLMSLVMMVFMVVPILAPTVGQAVLYVGPWRWIFAVLFVAGLGLAAWTAVRMQETLRPELRRSLEARVIFAGYAETLRTRATVVPMLAMSLAMGALMAFITSVQQIFQDVYQVGENFPLLFALIAVGMSLGSFLNARWVRIHGTARIARHALTAFSLISAAFVALSLLGWVDLVLFMVLQSLSLTLFGFVGANLNALAMEPMAHLAGTASSAIGAFTTIGGALLGGFVGQQFDGTVTPLAAGNLALSTAALIVFVVGQRSRTASDQ